MRLTGYIDRLFSSNKELYHWLNLIFALFFLVPVCGFIFFGFKYDIMTDHYFALFFLFFLIFSLIGFITLRRIFDRVTTMSREISEKIASEFMIDQPPRGPDDLNNIMETFGMLEGRFGVTFGQLQQKVSEISALKEISDLCYVSFDTEEILYVTLERALKLAGADIGSVLILERPHRKSFIVKATIGLGEQLKLGERVDFADSIAKYAVINKSPLIVEDIEKDTRFGRKNRQQYGTKSFVCMPIKTMRDIVGVLTISRKEDAPPFTSEHVEILSTLLANAAFTYENLQLLEERKKSDAHLDAMQKIVQIINSSLKGPELLRTILGEIQLVVPFDLALILMKDGSRPNDIRLLDFMAAGPVRLSKDAYYPCQESVLDKVIKQGVTLIVDETSRLLHESEKELLAGSRSGILAPLKIEGNVTGIMILCAQNPDLFYRLRDVIDRMADALSVAMERTRLSDYAVKRDQELDTLKQIGGALASSTFDIGQILDHTMGMISTLMNVQAGALLLMREDELEFIAGLNIDMEEVRGVRIKVGQGVAGYVATRGNAVIVNDMAASSLFSPDVDTATDFYTKTVLCVPMISEGRVTGVIEVLNKTDGDFDSGDKQLLQSIASSVSVAIENANRYREAVSMAEYERKMRRTFQRFAPKGVVDTFGHDIETG